MKVKKKKKLIPYLQIRYYPYKENEKKNDLKTNQSKIKIFYLC